MGLNEECAADCDQAIKIDPLFPKSYYRKAKAQVNLEKPAEAMETLKEGLEKIPEEGEFKILMQNFLIDIEEGKAQPKNKADEEKFKIEKTHEVAEGDTPVKG